MKALKVYCFRRLIKIEFSRVNFKFNWKKFPWVKKEIKTHTEEFVSLRKYRVFDSEQASEEELRGRVNFSQETFDVDESVLQMVRMTNGAYGVKIVGKSFDVVEPQLTLEECKDKLNYSDYLLLISNSINTLTEEELNSII